MITKNDLIFITPSKEMNEVADFLASKRQLFEYPRAWYWNYDKRGNHKIKIWILWELAFFDYIYSYLEAKTKDLEAKNRWKVLRENACFHYQIIIWNFDWWFEFKIWEKEIDIKTYETREVEVSDILWLEWKKPLNLFIDSKQNAKDSNIYVQSFIMKNWDVCLAWYNDWLPPLQTWMPQPAYTRAVPELTPISNILKLINL